LNKKFEINTTKRRIQMEEPIITSKAAFTIVGMKYRGKNEKNEIPQLWDQFMTREGEIEEKLNPHLCYGVEDNFDENTHEFDYVAAFEVPGDAEAPEGMVKWEVPAQSYAVFTCTLPTIREAYDTAYRSWLPQSGYQRAAGPEFELYDQDFDPRVPSSKMYLYIPIKE
jgi:AraC family transcriptional regulator